MKKIFEDIKHKYNNVYLFKRDIQGNVIYWKARVNHPNTCIAFYHGRISSTFLDDSLKSFRNIDEGTNIGKSNETNVVEQCYKELESEYKNHIKKGYKQYKPISYDIDPEFDILDYLENSVDKTNTDALGFAKPMKCQKFELGKVKYPCIGQPKYNGVRATISINYFKKDMFDDTPILILSKEGVEYKLNHLNIELYKILKYLEEQGINNPVLDGEIYLPNTPVTTIGGSARNESNPYNKQLQFVIFDLSIENICQKDRLEYINTTGLYYHSNTYIAPRVYKTPSVVLNNDEESLEYLDTCLALGYEGAVTRQYEPEYAFGQRPMFMRKLKKFSDAEFEVIDIVPYGDSSQNVGTGCKFILKNDLNDSTFECIPKGTTAERLGYFANKGSYIGNKVTAKFYERTINNIPFHANIIGLRNYEK